jgi:hydrogenase maturation protein HypF
VIVADEVTRAARRYHVTGVVQGVGFRPFVHRLAMRHRLGGWIRNASGEVEIAVEGSPEEIEAFEVAMRGEAPPLARIDEIVAEQETPAGRDGFVIESSLDEADGRQPVPADVALCPLCEAELCDPANRRYRYPFITCTDCGPRYTVIEALPYDRARTSMRHFTQCPACEAEYRDPASRRYHSETNSCPHCGPRVWLDESRAAAASEGADAVARAVELLRQGAIVAVRGMGGFHLACDATSGPAVRRLRERKGRDAKPFAVMVASVAEARRLALMSEREAELLLSRERPIVLLRAASGSPVAAEVAPGLGTIGVMLASTPLHLLLLDGVGVPLVMTSGNRSEEPIATANEESRERLGAIADAYLLHDREILTRADDSVMRLVRGAPVFLRRARGFAPIPIELPVASPVPLLAVGPHLKNTFTLVHGRTAWVSQHIGDLESMETLRHFETTLETVRRLFHVVPDVVVRDLHPGYLSTRLAEQRGLDCVISVQHHHAHIAAVMGEHGVTEPVLGVAFDGTGYGEDGAVWGAEFLLADLKGFRRLAHLRYAPLPGGDLVARRPWRAALGYAMTDHAARPILAPAWEGIPAAEVALAEQQVEAGVNAPMASSMGRLFDAAAAVIGVRQVAFYEGQAAMELESLAADRIAAEHACHIEEDGRGGWIINPVPLLSRLAHLRRRRVPVADLAADFHASIAWMTADVVRHAADRYGISTVALGGGVFQNARLLASVIGRLEARGLHVLAPRRLSPNDGSVSYGQAVVAAALLATL